MSTQVSNSTFKAYLANEDLLRERQNSQSQIKLHKEKSRKVAIESSHSKYFTDGVRAPLLSDITFGLSCRLDVVRPTKKVQSTGSVSPESPGRKTIIPHISLERERSNVSYSDRSSNSIKSMKFLLPNGTVRSKDDPDTTTRSCSDLDFRWKNSSSRGADARDVVYRNTYCDSHKKFRYRTMTLPSISAQNTGVPRVNKTKTTTKKKTMVNESPRRNISTRESNAPNSTNLFSKNHALNGEEGFLKVQKIKSLDDLPNGDEPNFLIVRQPTDLYSQNSSYPLELRTERPLKYETVGPHGSRLHRRHSSLRNMLPNSYRDYKSADAYKEYLEAIKVRMELDSEASARVEKDLKMHQFGRENRLLQSVIDVNLPNDRHEPLSHDSKSLVIEIKPTWNEVPNGFNDDTESDVDIPFQKCPVNTPAHD